MTSLAKNPILAIVIIIIVIIIVIWIFGALARSGENGWDSRGSRGGFWGDDSRRGSDSSSRRELPANKIGCSDSGPRPDKPLDVSCRSNESFELEVKWRHPRCHVAKYLVYLKHSDSPSPSHSSDSSKHSPSHSSHHVEAGNQVGCGCQSSSSSSPYESCNCGACSSSSSSSSAPVQDCGCNKSNRRHRTRAGINEQHIVGCGCDSCKSSSSSSSSSSPSSSSSSSCSPDQCECGPHSYTEIIEVEGSKNFVRITDIHYASVCVCVTAISECGRESHPSNCCTTTLKCSCDVFPCITHSDCKGLSLRWNKTHCAKNFKIYYDNTLKFTVPGDASGAKSLPPLNQTTPEKVYVSTISECGESEKVEASNSCQCKGDDCGKCHRCKKVACSCGESSSSSSSSDSDHHSRHRDHSSSSSSDSDHSSHHSRHNRHRRHE